MHSGPTPHREDSKYHVAQSNADCPKSPTGSTSTTPKNTVTTSSHSTTTTAEAATIPGSVTSTNSTV